MERDVAWHTVLSKLGDRWNRQALRITFTDLAAEFLNGGRGGGILLDLGGGSGSEGLRESHGQEQRVGAVIVVDRQREARPDVVADAAALPFASEALPFVWCQALLEHVQAPQAVADELYRVLQTGGKAFVYAPFLYPFHGGPEYGDYWRYTVEGLAFLFGRFREIQVQPVGGYLSTALRFSTGYRWPWFGSRRRWFVKASSYLESFLWRLASRLLRRSLLWFYLDTSGWNVVVTK